MPLVSVEKASFVWDGGAVSGFWHHPTRGATYLALAHGAGGNLHTPSLVHFAEALAEAWARCASTSPTPKPGAKSLIVSPVSRRATVPWRSR